MSSDNGPKTPSFQPWADRVRQIRTWVGVAAAALVGAYQMHTGATWEHATFVGLASCGLAMFVAWASALWICTELYYVEISRQREIAVEHEQERIRQMQELYRQRVLGGYDSRDGDLALIAEPDQPGNGAQAA